MFIDHANHSTVIVSLTRVFDADRQQQSVCAVPPSVYIYMDESALAHVAVRAPTGDHRIRRRAREASLNGRGRFLRGVVPSLAPGVLLPALAEGCMERVAEASGADMWRTRGGGARVKRVLGGREGGTGRGGGRLQAERESVFCRG